MNADEKTIVTQAKVQARDPKWRLRNWVLAVALAVSVIGLVWGAYSNHVAKNAAVQAQSEAALAGRMLAAQLQQHGLTPVVQPPAPITPVPGPRGLTGPGPTQRQIDDAVAAYCSTHNQCGATPAMVAVQVASYLTANPPKPGPPPTQAQIATAASTYIAAHAADFQGKPGQNGTNGQDATDAQVQAAVAGYCDAHSDCAGADGKQGAQGVSMTDLQFTRDQNGACQVVITLHDPATGDDSTITHPAGDAACQVPPVTTPSPLLKLGGN